MTKEEMQAKAVDNAVKRIKEVDKNTLSAIADYDRGLIQGFEDGAEWMQERMIEKAAEWLYVYYPTLERSKSFEDAWKHFKRAMEEKMQESNEGKALLYAVEKTAERTKREFVEKAVRWLDGRMCFKDLSSGGGSWGEVKTLGGYESLEEFIDEFKQAMQDESTRLD